MSIISTEQRNKLFLQLKHDCGSPPRPFELENEPLLSFLEMAIEDYSALVNEWLITQQWVGLQGLNISHGDFLNAFAVKSIDWERSFTYAYSKQVGQGTNAPSGDSWVLKRDFITTSADTQVYTIPAGREVNEVLWETPPEIDQGLVDPFALTNWGAGQFGWSYMGRPAQYVQPTYSLLLAAQDRNLKERILGSELTYRITGGRDGTKLLYLYPVPGGRAEIRGIFGKHFAGRKVWYYYYEIPQNERNKCLEQNPDIVRLPSDVPLDTLKWDKLNSVARQQVRNLFFGRSKIVIGKIRGFATGEVGATDKQLTLDYRMFLDEGETLITATAEKILDALNKISLVQLTTDRATIAENTNAIMSRVPMMFPIMTY